jgi:hypothetical protein
MIDLGCITLETILLLLRKNAAGDYKVNKNEIRHTGEARFDKIDISCLGP